MSDEEFKAGDFVTVFGNTGMFGGYGPLKILKVRRVLTRFIELSDDSKWNHFGRPYPSQSGYHQPDIRLATVEHKQEIKKRKLRNAVEQWARNDISTATLEDLEAIAAVIWKKEEKQG